MSGAGSKAIRVYDCRTGERAPQTTRSPEAGFINDNVVTRQGVVLHRLAACQQLYFIPFGKKGALGELQRIPITGDFVSRPAGFNAQRHREGQGRQDADPGQEQHRASCSPPTPTTGVDEGASRSTGGDGELDNGDGMLRKGRKLYVVENRDDA